MKVYILEDSADLGQLLCEFLKMEKGADCASATSFAQLLKDPEPALSADLVVLDVNLGTDQPSGIDAYEWLRDQGYRGRVIFLTGHGAGHPLVKKARALSGVPVLEKPVEAERLLELL